MPDLDFLLDLPWVDGLSYDFDWYDGDSGLEGPGYRLTHTIEGVTKNVIENALKHSGWSFYKVKGGWMECAIYSNESLGLESE